jgi:hypothetical protein
MLENLKCYRKVRSVEGLPVNVSFRREAWAMREADIATWGSATAVLQPFSVREYCLFCSSNIAYSEYITGRRESERENTEMFARETATFRRSGIQDSLTEIT